MRPLTQLLGNSDGESLDFAYHICTPTPRLRSIRRGRGEESHPHVRLHGQKARRISANRVMDFSILDELGTKRNQRAQK
jgi:hypothetical protein